MAAASLKKKIHTGRTPDTPAVFIESASLPTERRVVTTLQALRDGPTPSFEGPAILLVGEVFRELSLGAMEHEAEVRLAITERCQARTA